jgi:hypothetical protein
MIFNYHKCLVIHNNDLNTIVAIQGVKYAKNELHKLEVPSIKSSMCRLLQHGQ